jgi:16S rRNA (uracil1498-N3)-methyltransferase
MSVRLYVDAALQRDAEIDLPAAAARHVQVRRLQPGDPLRLFNGRGGEWQATVLRMGRSQVVARVGDFDPVERELGLQVTVALGMPANERMDLLVEKATELGVHAIQPLQCERSVLRLAGERALRKCEHWQAIAAAAAEQCGRTRVPQIAAVQTLERFLAQPPTAALRVLLSPAEGAAPLHAVVADGAALLTLSGPEGGLSPAEEAAARAAGFVPARLGERVLRAETAPLATLAWIGLRGLASERPAPQNQPATTGG